MGCAGRANPKALARGFFDKPKPPPRPTPKQEQARKEVLSGVVERNPDDSSRDSKPPAPLSSVDVAAQGRKEEAPKKVSRFKQQRMAGNS